MNLVASRIRGRAIARVSACAPLLPGQPVIFSDTTGSRTRSTAGEAWTIARLRAEHADAVVPVRVSERGAPQLFAGDPQRAFQFQRMRLAEVVDGFALDGATRYVQLCDLAHALPRLAAGVPTPAQAGTLYASPAYAWICGGGTVNPLHFDLNEALLAQVVGEKHFLLFPPEDSPRIAGRVERAIFRTTSLDFLQPDRERFPRLDGATPYEAVVGPGDVLYIPYRWWHAMVALEPSVSVTWWWEPSHMAHVHNALRQRAVDAAKSVLRALRVT